MTKHLLALALLAPLFAGCSSIQKVDPVSGGTPEKLCIIKNPKVRDGFLNAYQAAAQARGISVQVMPEGSAFNACPLTSAYTASWNWDLALYMRYAQITVYRDGRAAGVAEYDAHTAVFSKFINADQKIQELVGQLFPLHSR